MEIVPYYTLKEFEESYLKDYLVFFDKGESEISLIDYFDKLNKYYSELQMLLSGNLDNNLLSVIKDKFNWNVFREFVDGKFPELNLIPDYSVNAALDEFNEMNKLHEHQIDIGISLYMELNAISSFLTNKIIETTINNKTNIASRKNKKVMTNPKKLALLQTIGFFDLPIMRNLSEDNQNEVIALLLDADKKEFVYKNRLNLNSIDPNYQTDKYTAFQYVDEMEEMLKNMQ